VKRKAVQKKKLDAEAAKHADTNKEKKKKRYMAEAKGHPIKYQRYTDGRKAKH